MCSCSVLLSETNIKKARKQYNCGASEFLRDIGRNEALSNLMGK